MSLSRFLTHHRRTDGISWGTQQRQLAYLGTQHGRHAAWKNACRPEPRLRRGSSVARVRTLLLCRQFTGSRRTRGDPGGAPVRLLKGQAGPRSTLPQEKRHAAQPNAVARGQGRELMWNVVVRRARAAPAACIGALTSEERMALQCGVVSLIGASSPPVDLVASVQHQIRIGSAGYIMYKWYFYSFATSGWPNMTEMRTQRAPTPCPDIYHGWAATLGAVLLILRRPVTSHRTPLVHLKPSFLHVLTD